MKKFIFGIIIFFLIIGSIEAFNNSRPQLKSSQKNDKLPALRSIPFVPPKAGEIRENYNISLSGTGAEAEKGCGCGCSVTSIATPRLNAALGNIIIIFISWILLSVLIRRKK